MEDIKSFIKLQYGIDTMLETPNECLSRGNILIGYDGSQEYIIKVEDKKMASIIQKLMLWAEANTSALVCFPRFLRASDGNYYAKLNDDILSIQHRECVQELTIIPDNLPVIGAAIAAFHQYIKDMPADSIPESNFYYDFMFGDVPKAQSETRLAFMQQFLERYTPDYCRLTKGICHNDLNQGNILLLQDRYLIIDYEHIKQGPLISDLGVFALQAWTDEEIGHYFDNLNSILRGYLSRVALNEYDKKCIILFSVRYLFSDENYYNYLLTQGIDSVEELISATRRKQDILLSYIMHNCDLT